jgi:hypothetical protein
MSGSRVWRAERRGGVGLLALLAVLGGCVAAPRVVPVPAGGAALDPAQRSVAVQAEGVQLVVRTSAWRGSPAFLPGYVTPFHLLLVNGSPHPVEYGYADLRLFDEERFQYTALPPVEVGRLLRSREPGDPEATVATASETIPHRRRPRFVWDPFWDPWWWGPRYHPYPDYHPYYAPYGWPSADDVLSQALPVGTLAADARSQGFVYFPRLRPAARRLSFEMHYRLGSAARVFTLPFAVERAARGGAPVETAIIPR